MTAAEELLTLAEAAKQLRVSRSSIYRLRRSGELPVAIIAGKLLVKQSDVDKLVARS